MLSTQLEFMVSTFGDPSLDYKDRWKSIKYIFSENPLVDVQSRLEKGEIVYIEHPQIGPGFYILEEPCAQFGVDNLTEKVITFIPLYAIDKISMLTNFIDAESNPDDENPWGAVTDTINLDSDMFRINNMTVDELIKASDYINKFDSSEEFMSIIE